MFDFLKAQPSVTREEYMWRMTVAQIQLATHDSTHVVYLNEKQAKKIKGKTINNAEDLMNDLGMKVPIL